MTKVQLYTTQIKTLWKLISWIRKNNENPVSNIATHIAHPICFKWYLRSLFGLFKLHRVGMGLQRLVEENNCNWSCSYEFRNSKVIYDVRAYWRISWSATRGVRGKKSIHIEVSRASYTTRGVSARIDDGILVWNVVWLQSSERKISLVSRRAYKDQAFLFQILIRSNRHKITKHQSVAKKIWNMMVYSFITQVSQRPHVHGNTARAVPPPPSTGPHWGHETRTDHSRTKSR